MFVGGVVRGSVRGGVVRAAGRSHGRMWISTQAVCYGPGTDLSLAKQEVGDKLGSGQVLVKLEAAAVNSVDLLASKGLIPGAPAKGVAGNQGVGVVEKVGAGVSGIKKGDRVVPIKPGVGTWAAHAVADEASLAVVPKDIDAAQAAQLGIQTAAALRVLSDSGLTAGDSVIHDAADEGFVQIAKALGLNVISVTKSGLPDFKKYSSALKSAGSDLVVDAAMADSDAVRKACAELKPKLAVHSDLSSTSATALARALAPGGTLVSVTGAGPVTVPSSLLINRGITVKGFNLQNALANDAASTLNELLDLVKSGKLNQSVATTESLENFGAAVQAAKVGSKVLLKM